MGHPILCLMTDSRCARPSLCRFQRNVTTGIQLFSRSLDIAQNVRKRGALLGRRLHRHQMVEILKILAGFHLGRKVTAVVHAYDRP